MPIDYPKFFEDTLRDDRGYTGAVDQLTATFDAWLSTSRLPFFPDYTDHGINHVNGVLTTADSLMTAESRQIVTTPDIAVLAAAVLFHDSAMHLSEVGFYQLVKGSSVDWQINGFGDQPWPVVWDEFLFGAKRWDERQLRNVLGETPNGKPRTTVRDPFSHYEDLTDGDRRLIGEFIRVNHARMAHEFAVNGIPGNTRIDLTHTLPAELRDIAGLVGRSHGMAVRDCQSYLETHYHRREYAGVHAVYLMILLRISDYLQIQASRAPRIVFQYRHIPSKRSRLEWRAHQAVLNITQTHDDPEAIQVQANPQDVETYLRLRTWLSGLQAELDSSWAVLGETYGLQPRLSKLGVILRRVRSNLEANDYVPSDGEFVRERIELSVARADLLKLLVGPLYDNVASIGIRELLQNALDAVRERISLQAVHAELTYARLMELAADVEVSLGPMDEDGNSWLIVADQGIGMTVETIRDYFLTAGASFRNSESWKREFETDGTTSSRVLRSGRFGVGVLAAFLLGPVIEVETRHIRSEYGIRFRTELNLEPIELRYDRSINVGTRIRIPVSARTRRELLESGPRVSVPALWDWFLYDRPRVDRKVDDTVQLTQQIAVTPPEVPGAIGFRQLPGEWRYDVYWTYRELPLLSVNGIHVTNSAHRSKFPEGHSRGTSWIEGAVHCRLTHPRVCVHDPDGQFPLNLQRTDITEARYAFGKELLAEVMDDYIAYALVHLPERPSGALLAAMPVHPGIEAFAVVEGLQRMIISPFLLTAKGYTFAAPDLPQVRQHDAVTFVFPGEAQRTFNISRHDAALAAIVEKVVRSSVGMTSSPMRGQSGRESLGG